MKQMKYLVILFLLAFGASACQTVSSTSKITTDTLRYGSIHLETGIPRDADSTDDYLMIRPQYAVSYNNKRNVPNWVSWNLNASWYGDAPRYSGNFITDVSLPSHFVRVTHGDYTNSGFDRGHLVRSEERTRNDEDNRSTFLMTNIIPQAPELNRLGWLRFEEECERLCKQGNKELYVISGGVFKSGATINNKVAIPDSCWKIVVVLERGQTLSNITATTQVLAVMMPNTAEAINDWKPYTTTVAKVEVSTGYSFFRAVPDAVRTMLKNQ
ncbi:MAG: DNA/RNA non-specific endonuclease [Ignavibacteria bacterium]|nr:DNA/RNA non-specific endonuclease [Ignavibacteria bacterium]